MIRKSRRPADTENCLAKFNGHNVPYVLVRSRAARHARLEIRPESELRVIIPAAYPRSFAEALIKSKQSWILRKLQHIENNRRISACDDDSVHYLGRKLALVCVKSDDATPQATAAGDILLLRLPAGLDAKTAAETWLKAQSRVYLNELVWRLNRHMGVNCSGLRISSARTRWGSCSPRGGISLNWKLIMAKPEAIEYVVIHELCHLEEMNHAPAFWRLVQKYCPDWREQRKWLSDHAGLLSA
ncbi:MAG: M48 family metallopeptidase [Dehalococcoidia bacterium]|nr:M48 family metallopeptidase [Dehalococcoidia bacterium]